MSEIIVILCAVAHTRKMMYQVEQYIVLDDAAVWSTDKAPTQGTVIPVGTMTAEQLAARVLAELGL